MARNLTPMMRQYLELKEKYSDCLLFFRLGDFYEMFFDDAKTAAKELELVLTGRDCGLEERAPMCGVPYHSVDVYINRLIEKGYKVAICEQMEDPALAKGLVERDVIRIITPGTVIEERMLDEGRNNYIVSIHMDGGRIGFAYADVSTGGFFACELEGERALTQLTDELARLQPTQIIAGEGLFLQPLLCKRLSSQYYLERYQDRAFQTAAARERLLRHFHVASLQGFGCEGLPAAISAAGALMQYLEETQKNALSHIHTLRMLNRSSYMNLDAATRRNLELTQPLQHGGSRKNTLLYLLDRTKTAMGSRLLRDWIDRPLQNAGAIVRRQEAVAALAADMPARRSLQEQLAGVYDIERLCSRIVYGSINGRDCIALRNSLRAIPAVQQLLQALAADPLREDAAALDPMEDIAALLAAAIAEEPPAGVKDGGVIRDGYNSEVDQLRAIQHGSRQWLADFEAAERERTGIRNLRVGYNRVFGYYIEITKSNLSQAPYEYERKQTLANAERFITPELKQMEEKILGAGERLIALEYELFQAVREALLAVTDRLQHNAALIARLDVYQSFAEVAVSNRYCRPHIREDGVIRIVDGRHPVVERTLREEFVPNDVQLDNAENRLLIITGPNMAGKSTYMRQVALITLMAHIGSFVPAREADIALVDRIFTRVGASDDLSAGQSTFMVEMSEVANILNNATAQSLLILDEIGRGTSTFDGLSIAWSVLEHIADPALCGAKTLFATHYHELTELEGKLPGVKNYRVTVKEMGEDILFLRRIVRGGADRSFGIQVARLAGLPEAVLARARQILADLESADIARGRPEPPQESAVQASLFDASAEETALRMLRELDIDQLTPLDALNRLYALRAMLQQS